jgi:hypothetical protein
MTQNGWSQRFDDPIPLRGGTELATLREVIAHRAAFSLILR